MVNVNAVEALACKVAQQISSWRDHARIRGVKERLPGTIALAWELMSDYGTMGGTYFDTVLTFEDKTCVAVTSFNHNEKMRKFIFEGDAETVLLDTFKTIVREFSHG